MKIILIFTTLFLTACNSTIHISDKKLGLMLKQCDKNDGVLAIDAIRNDRRLEMHSAIVYCIDGARFHLNDEMLDNY